MLPKDLSQFQLPGLVGLGVVFWGMAAYKVRYAGHIVYANDLRRLSMFLSTIPLGYVAIRFSEGLLAISPKERLTTTSVMCSSALLLDGIVFMWFPTLIYENSILKQKNPSSAVAFSRMGAAWILYGVGVCLGIALLT
jgi:hypothetical protein